MEDQCSGCCTAMRIACQVAVVHGQLAASACSIAIDVPEQQHNSVASC
jgi:hypothetical protein